MEHQVAVSRGRLKPSEVALKPTFWEEVVTRRKRALAEVSSLIAIKEETKRGLKDTSEIALLDSQIGALKDQAAVARKVWDISE